MNHRTVWLTGVMALCGAPISWAEKQPPGPLAAFSEIWNEADWQQKAGAHPLGYMRPEGDEGWQARMRTMQGFVRRGDDVIPLLLDPSLTVSAAYGVAFQMRIHTEWSNRPATFIIDKEGILRYARRAQTFSDRPSVTDILAELSRLNRG